jgi:hypothetical protein
MLIPTVTEILHLPEATTPDPFITGIGRAGGPGPVPRRRRT